MANKSRPERCTIADMECINRKLAAEELKMSESTLGKLMSLSRRGKARPALKFFQRAKGCDAWFPLPWIKEYVTEVGEH